MMRWLATLLALLLAAAAQGGSHVVGCSSYGASVTCGESVGGGGTQTCVLDVQCALDTDLLG